VIVSFTGVSISFPNAFAPAFQTVFGGSAPDRIPAVAEVAGAQDIGADRAVALALQAVPEAQLSALTLPANAAQAYRVQLVGNNAIAGAPVINTTVDPYKGEVTSVRDPREYALGDSVMAWQRTIHDGRTFGPVWAFLVFLVGLLPPLFAVTGTMMWWLTHPSRQTLRDRDSMAVEGMPAE
jgi:uncharacterized iron-regulated membrane protein